MLMQFLMGSLVKNIQRVSRNDIMSFERFKIMRGSGFSLFPNTRLLKHVQAALLRLSVYNKPYANMPYPAFCRIEATQKNLQCAESQWFFFRESILDPGLKLKCEVKFWGM